MIDAIYSKFLLAVTGILVLSLHAYLPLITLEYYEGKVQDNMF